MSSTTNTIKIDSFFSDTVTDNNGNLVTDVNAGLINLFGTYNDYRDELGAEQLYLVKEFEEGYPDLIAYTSILASQEYWWWILLLNDILDPFTELKANWVYSINSSNQIEAFISESNSNKTTSTDTTTGTIVELN